MYKVLVYGFSDVPGGIENFIINYIDEMDSNIHFDFINVNYDHLAYEDQIVKKNGKILKLQIPSILKNPIRQKIILKNFAKKYFSQYDCIWFNLTDLNNITLIKLANKYSCKRIIIHSHNSRPIIKSWKTRINAIRHYLHKKKIINLGTDFWSCSDKAKEWLFPKNLYKDVKIVKNAIDVDKFKFSLKERNKIRLNLKIKKRELVLGVVGRLNPIKNQIFAINVLKALKDKKIDAKLILIGDGVDRNKLEIQVNLLGLNSYVNFMGTRNDVQNWYSSFDCLLFPSLSEGLGLVGIEAQANGLPVFASKGCVPEEIKINSNFYFLNLKDGPTKWANAILDDVQNNRKSFQNIKQSFIKNGYELTIESKKLEKMFIKYD